MQSAHTSYASMVSYLIRARIQAMRVRCSIDGRRAVYLVAGARNCEINHRTTETNNG